MTQETENFDQLPDAIVERLRARDRSLSVLTPEVDRALRHAAQARFSRRSSRPAARRWFYPVAAAAAAAVIAIIVIRPFEADSGLEVASVGAPFVADDVDASGQVDILDAFALARARADDRNTASQAGIDALASRIVSLSEAVL
jgi:hypothetical protein